MKRVSTISSLMARRLASLLRLKRLAAKGAGCLVFTLSIAVVGQSSFAAAPEDPSAAGWLNRMTLAFAELDYDGVFSFWTGREMASLRVVHMSKDGVEHERLVHLNGAPREIIRDGEKVLCILQPGDRLVAMGGSIPAGPFARAFIRDFSDVSSHYELSMKGEDRVAARPAVRMLVKPRDKHRYGYRLWLDKETGLLLKSELMDEKQRAPLEVFQFNQVVTGAGVNAAALVPEQPTGSVIDHLKVAEHQPGQTHPEVKWRASWLPDGFEMAASDLRHAPATKQDVSTLMYSDGLAAISVFVENMPNAAATNMMTRKGATVSVTRLVHGPDDAKHLVTVIGEVPPNTAAEIASKIAYAN